MATFMFSSQGELGATGLHIHYEQLLDLAKDYRQLSLELTYTRNPQIPSNREMMAAGTTYDGGINEFYPAFGSAINHIESLDKLNIVHSFVMPASLNDLGAAGKTASRIADALETIYELVDSRERNMATWDYHAEGYDSDPQDGWPANTGLGAIAETFYAQAAEEEKARQAYEKKKGELDSQYGDWLNKVKHEYPELYVELIAALNAEELAAFEAYLQEYYPEDYERYKELMAAQQAIKEHNDYLERIKEEDPDLYDQLMAEEAAQRHAEWEKDMQENHPEDWAKYQQLCEDRRGIASREEYEAWLERVKEESPALYDKLMEQEAAKAHAEWEADLQANHPEEWKLYQQIKAEEERLRKEAEAAEQTIEAAGGLGDSGDLGGFGGSSDFGGGGSFGSSDDWSDSLLSDTVDAEELASSGDALNEVADGTTDAAVETGADAVEGEEVAEGDASFWGRYGDQIASFAHAYGLRAAALAGGAAALYATREQTTEAVALAAEFVSARCRPFASDVLDQVRGAAKQTKVSVSGAKSRTTRFTHGDEEEGDLLG